jgi:hypothetical protein
VEFAEARASETLAQTIHPRHETATLPTFIHGILKLLKLRTKAKKFFRDQGKTGNWILLLLD